MSGSILMNDSASGGLVYSLDCFLVSNLGSGLITGLNSSVELLNHGLELGISYFVDKSLLLDNKNTLLCRFDVCQNYLPPYLDRRIPGA